MFRARFGSAERHRNEMDAPPLGGRQSQRESLLTCGVEKYLVAVVAQGAGCAVDLPRRFADGLSVPARPRDLNVDA